MSHITHVNESRHTYERVMSQIRMLISCTRITSHAQPQWPLFSWCVCVVERVAVRVTMYIAVCVAVCCAVLQCVVLELLATLSFSGRCSPGVCVLYSVL